MPDSLKTLVLALRALRQSWPHDWPGLEPIAQSCLLYLQIDRSQRACAARIDCLLQLAERVEADGIARAQAGAELAYHNRLHIADTLVSLAVLVAEQRKVDPAPVHLSRPMVLEALIAMVAHDFLHDGSINRYPGEIESRSCEAIRPMLSGARLPEATTLRVCDWILATDPVAIASHHQRLNGRAFALTEPSCMQALINEADILASALPEFADKQTEALVQERLERGVPDAADLRSERSRRRFLERIAIFSSDASRRMGLAQLRADQLRWLGGTVG